MDGSSVGTAGQTPWQVTWDSATMATGWGGVTLAHNVRSPHEVDAIIEEAEAAGAKIARRRAMTLWVATLLCSSTRMATHGRSRTIPTGS